MRPAIRHTLAVIIVVVGVIALAAAGAGAFSQTDTGYYDGLQDLTGLDSARSHDVALDALGGVRLVTNGSPAPFTWTSTADFTSPTPSPGTLVGLSTLDAATTPDTLKLASSEATLRRSPGTPVLSASAPLSVDGYGVGGPCVQRVGDTYYLWYTGVPENEFKQRIYLATSTNGGVTWTKEPDPVIEPGETGSFDSRQLGRPAVIYDAAWLPSPSPSPSPTDTTLPSPTATDTGSPSPSPSPTPGRYQMWYSAEGDFGGSIGYATSTDGRTWEKLGEVFGPGKPGLADSYSVSQPCVILDNGIYRMWYTASDGNNRRIGYATSLDGVTWQRGGIVFDVSGGGNYSEGAYAPTVWKNGANYNMVFTAAKQTGGGIQQKLYNASTTDGGITWVPGSVAYNGAPASFDDSNLSQAYVLPDPTDATNPFKMWYVGNNVDPANPALDHDRIGLLGQKTGAWKDIHGPLGDPYYGAVLTCGAQSTAFDSMWASDLQPQLGMTKGPIPGGGYALNGWFTGTKSLDSIPRIGAVFSTDSGAAWGASAMKLDAGPAGAFDAGGVAAPAAIWVDGVPDPSTGYWMVYHTSISAAGVLTVGLHQVDDLGAVTRYATPAVAAGLSGSGADAAGCADPAIVTNGLFYAGKDGSGIWSILRTVAPGGLQQTYSSATPALTAGPEAYDVGGARHPVILEDGGTWRMWYAATGSDGVSRIAYATSSDGGVTWTKKGLAMTPSTAAYDFAEKGVEPSGVWKNPTTNAITLWFTGTDRFGWKRCGAATVGGPGFIDGGSATFELDHASAMDWRRILWNPVSTPADTARELWVSYFPTYSGGWSQWMPVANDTDLPFLLTVQNVRWQVRMTSSDAAVTPQLDDLTINRAPISFPTAGSAVSLPIGPPAGKYLLTWGDLTVDADAPGTTGVTVAVEDEGGTLLKPAAPITGGGTTTISLADVPATSGRLVVVLELTGDGLTTPKVRNFGVTYTTTSTPSSLTLSASPAAVAYNGKVTLNGTLMSDTTPLAGQTVTVTGRALSATASPAPVATATTAADGSFSVAGIAIPASTMFKAAWPGGDIGGTVYPPAVGTARADAKAKVTLSLVKYNKRVGKYRCYKYGRAVAIKGAVAPNHALLGDGTTPGKVVVKIYKKKSIKWVFLKQSSRTLTSGSGYTWSWRPRARGTYRIVTSFAADSDHLAAVSPWRYCKVY